MKRLIFVLIILFIFIFSLNLSAKEVTLIYLKDSSIVLGKIIRDVPGDKLWLKSGDSVHIIKYSMITKVTEREIDDYKKDIIFLKDGPILAGNIIEIKSDKSIRIITGTGSTSFIPYSNLQKIEYRSFNFNIEKFDKSYFEFGFSIGTPSGINVLLGGFGGNAGFSISGFILPMMSGIQGNLNLKMMETHSTLINFAIIGGSSQVKKNDGYVPYSSKPNEQFKFWTYYGVALDINVSGIFLEVGVSDGKGDFQSPQLCFQIGYVFRCN